MWLDLAKGVFGTICVFVGGVMAGLVWHDSIIEWFKKRMK